MTSNGRRIAFLIGVAVAFMLPKRVECGYPGAECIVERQGCRPYEIEPLGFFLLEHAFKRNVGFGYSTGTDC